MERKADTPEEYIEQLPDFQKDAFEKLRTVILDNLPAGFVEAMSSGMISYVVPHSEYPSGYHCNPEQPLPFISIAAQKTHLSLYHLGLYADTNTYNWFVDEYKKAGKVKVDIGKSCIRFKKEEHIPFELIGQLIKEFSVNDWIEIYETKIKK